MDEIEIYEIGQVQVFLVCVTYLREDVELMGCQRGRPADTTTLNCTDHRS